MLGTPVPNIHREAGPVPATVDQATWYHLPPSCQPCASHIKLLYWNCLGLTQAKLFDALRLIESCSPSPAILCLAETWHTLDAHLAQLPSFITVSQLHRGRHHTGHLRGGMAVLASPSLKPYLSVTFVDQYHVAVCVESLEIRATFAYLPPTTLTNDALAINLRALPPTNVYMGDVNTTFPTITSAQSAALDPERRQVLSAFALARGLQLVWPAGAPAKLDHTFSSVPGATSTILPCPLGISDHPCIHAALPIPAEWHQHQQPPHMPCPSRIVRFRTQVLAGPKGPLLAELLQRCWRLDTQPFWTNAVERALAQSTLTPANELQDLLDTVYSSFSQELALLADDLFGEYQPGSVKMQQDLSSLSHMLAPSHAGAIRMFKRSMRSHAHSQQLLSRTGASVAEEAHAHYQHTYAATMRLESDDVPPLPAEEERIPWQECRRVFTITAVRKAIATYPTHKSGGADGIHTLFLKALIKEDGFCDILGQVFALCLHLGSSPTSWNLAVTHLLPKDPQSRYADKTRPISLTPILRRVYERLLLAHWQSDSVSWLHVNYAQAGFRHGYSTTSHILLADYSTKMVKSNYAINVCLDLKAAFDRVPYTKLLDALRDKGCPPAYLSVLYNLMMRDCRSALVVNGSILPPEQDVMRERGVFQGSVLSPSLFNVFIDQLAQVLNGVVPRADPPLVLFCDDIRILCDNVEATQHLIDVCYEWAAHNGMEFGLSKCAVLAARPLQLRLGDQIIPQAPEYQYLGYPLTPHGVDWIQHGLRRLQAATSMLDGLRGPSALWPEWVKLAIFKTFIRPKAAYGLELAYRAATQTRATHKAQSVRGAKLLKQPAPPAYVVAADQLCADMASFHLAALAWIFGSERGQVVMASLSALGSWEAHSEECLARLVGHLGSLDSGNPLKLLLPTSHLGLLRSKPSLLPLLLKHPLAKEYAKVRELPRPRGQLPPTMHTFLLGHRLKALLKENGVLQHYLLPPCRLPTSGVDRTLYIKDAALRCRALKWRLNRLPPNMSCPKCGQVFNRGHVNTCEFLNDVPSAQAWLVDVEAEWRRLVAANPLLANYSLLDHALNHGKYRIFAKSYAAIEASLRSRARAQEPDHPP